MTCILSHVTFPFDSTDQHVTCCVSLVTSDHKIVVNYNTTKWCVCVCVHGHNFTKRIVVNKIVRILFDYGLRAISFIFIPMNPTFRTFLWYVPFGYNSWEQLSLLSKLNDIKWTKPFKAIEISLRYLFVTLVRWYSNWRLICYFLIYIGF